MKKLSLQDKRWLAKQSLKLLEAAIEEDYDTAGDLIGEAGQRHGHAGVYCICIAMSAAIHRAAWPDAPRGDGSLLGDQFVAMQVETDGFPDGYEIPQEQIEQHPGVWAARFLVAYLNGDKSQTKALFFGCLGDRDRALGNVEAIVSLASGILRDRLAADDR